MTTINRNTDMKLLQHPLSAAFPAMPDDEYQALCDSIEIIGVQNPVTLLDGMVLDGWHRYNAAERLGMDCPSVDLGDVDPRDFVLAQNKARRNLTASQRAAAVTAVYQWRPHGDQRSAVTADREKNPAATADRAKTTKELAAIAGVGTRTIEQAKAVQAGAVKAVQDAVKDGAVTVETAAAIAKLPAKDQKKIAAKGSGAMRAAAKEKETPAPEDEGPNESEIAAQTAAEKSDREAIEKLLDSNDALATAYAEITRLNAVNAQLQQRLNGLMNEKNEAVKLCKLLQRRLDFAQKAAA